MKALDDSRKKGLAGEGELCFAMLHAAQGVQPLYNQIGFKSVTTSWARIRIDGISNLKRLEGSHGSTCAFQYIVKILDIDSEFEAVSSLSQQLCSSFDGPLVKDPVYVKRWVAQEAGESAVGVYCVDEGALTSVSELVGFAVLKQYPPGCIQIHDLGCKNAILPTVLRLVLLEGPGKTNPSLTQFISHVYLQLPLVQYLGELVGDIEVVQDHGWMFLDLDNECSSSQDSHVNFEDRLFFPIDNF